MQLSFSAVSYRYPGAAEPAVSDISFTIAEGWTGIVGPNGCGKSTLGRLACGDLKPDQGQISSGIYALYCRQTCDLEPEGLVDFAADYSQLALQLRDRLAIGEDWPWRYSTLSFGERKRLQVAVSLALQPDLLVLDEPGNHLDQASRQALLAALKLYRGIGLLISHDRMMLDTLVSRCYLMQSGRGQLRMGNYSAASRQEALERNSALESRQQARRELERLQAEKQRRAQKAQQSAARRSARKLDRHDRDGRGRIHLAIVSGQDGKAGRLSVQLDNHLAQIQQRLAQTQVAKAYAANVWLDTRPAARPVLLDLPAQTLPLGPQRSLVTPPLLLRHTDRIALSGPNGAGKSSLLRALLQQLDPKLNILYLPQELDEAAAWQTLAELGKLPDELLGRLLSIVLRLGSNPERILNGTEDSPGELRKLILARGMLEHPQVLILDEPTNHLDIVSIEALQQLLAACPCALLLVSHDQTLVKACGTIDWTLNTTQDGQSFLSVLPH
ncbi:MAG: ATP-binding cassette domain-containing protein [Oscillospiraceae bacterium]|nr:ATP-binding cassette domain-containing protein [Oscillospiraceae bacterium]